MVHPMTEAELQDTLADVDAPNVPQRLPGHQGSNPRLTTEESRERRAAMTTALTQGISRDAIMAGFAKRFAMAESAVRTLMSEVRAMWDDEDADHARYARGAARRRIHRHIQEASKDRKWTAVANLEKVMSDVEGTTQVEPPPPDADTRLSDAILSVLGQTDPQTVRVMIERERAYIELGNGAPEPQRATPRTKVIEGGG